MKKTLIALLALAGVATGDSLTLTSPANSVLTTGNSGLNWSDTENGTAIGNLESWTLSFTLTINSIKNNSVELFGSNGASNQGAQGYVLNASKDGYIYLTNGRVTQSQALLCTESAVFGPYSSQEAIMKTNENGQQVKDYDKYTFTENNVVAITLSFTRYEDEATGTALGGEFTLTIGNDSWSQEVTSTDNTTFIKNGNSRIWTNSGTQTFSGISLTRLDNKIIPSAPEPTTATLSLLALAGLAARRRRR